MAACSSWTADRAPKFGSSCRAGSHRGRLGPAARGAGAPAHRGRHHHGRGRRRRRRADRRRTRASTRRGACRHPDAADVHPRRRPRGDRAARCIIPSWGSCSSRSRWRAATRSELARTHPTGFGYLLKDRIVDVGTLVDALERVAAGGTVLDPDVVAHFLGRQESADRLRRCHDRERDVLALMAEGRSNGASPARCACTTRRSRATSRSIFTKLGLLPEPDDHRRVLAVRAWLEPGGVV